ASRRHAHRLAWRSLSWPVRGHRRRPGSPDRRTRTLGTLPTGWGEPPAASRAAGDPAKLIAPSSPSSAPRGAPRIGADRLLVKTQRTDHLSTTGDRQPGLVTGGGLCAGRVNLSIIRGCGWPLPLPPTHLVERQKERDRESLYTHPLENDKFGGRCF